MSQSLDWIIKSAFSYYHGAIVMCCSSCAVLKDSNKCSYYKGTNLFNVAVGHCWVVPGVCNVTMASTYMHSVEREVNAGMLVEDSIW